MKQIKQNQNTFFPCFSCILGELFTEQPLFTLSQMLDYRTNGYDPMGIVNKIIDVDIRVKIL